MRDMNFTGTLLQLIYGGDIDDAWLLCVYGDPREYRTITNKRTFGC